MQHYLTDLQLQAIELLVKGLNLGCVADTIDVRRETLWRWRQEPVFRAAWAEQREALRESIRDRMAELVNRSLDIIEAELTSAPSYAARQRQLPTIFNLLRVLRHSSFSNDSPSSPENSPLISHKDA